jgi:tetratricopeptide (TPR) repeat protein
MGRFRASYVDPTGATKIEWIEGPSVEWVLAHLERKGARLISVDESHLSTEGRNIAAEAAFVQKLAPQRAPLPSPPSPDEATDVPAFIDERLARPAPKKMPTPAKAAIRWLRLAAVFGVYAWLQRPAAGGRPSFLFTMCATAALATLVMGAFRVAPHWLGERARHARAWRDWPSVLRLTAIAAWHPLIRSRPALRYSFGTLRAAALAGTGRIDEGLALIERVARDNRQPESVVLMAKAAVYLAINRPDEGIALRRRAALDPARAFMNVDVAIAILEYRGDAEDARAQLAKVTARPASMLEAAFRSLAQGLLDIEEGRPTEAVAALTRARSAFEREVPLRALDAVILWSDPFLCLALARAGEAERATAMLPRVTRYLKATSQPRWLTRCREALARSRDLA